MSYKISDVKIRLSQTHLRKILVVWGEYHYLNAQNQSKSKIHFFTLIMIKSKLYHYLKIFF